MKKKIETKADTSFTLDVIASDGNRYLITADAIEFDSGYVVMLCSGKAVALFLNPVSIRKMEA